MPDTPQPATIHATQTVTPTPRNASARTSRTSIAAYPCSLASSLRPPPPPQPPQTAVAITTPRRLYSPFAAPSVADAARSTAASPPSPPPLGAAAQSGGRGGVENGAAEAHKGADAKSATNPGRDMGGTGDKDTKHPSEPRSEFKPYTPYTPGAAAQTSAKKDAHKLSPGKFSPPKIVAGLPLPPP